MPMGEEDRTECERDGISIHAGWGQTAIDTENGHARAIRFRKCLSVKNAEGRFAPAFDDARTETAEAPERRSNSTPTAPSRPSL